MRLIDTLRDWARRLKTDVIAVWLAARDPQTPWGVRLLALTVAAYALSPIDLIPDFIPVLGYLDDLLLVPLGLWLVIRLIPPAQMALFRDRAQAIALRPTSRGAAIAIVVIWLAVAVGLGWWGLQKWR